MTFESMDVDQTAQMARWVRERRDVLAGILRLTLQQEGAIQSGMVEALVEVLREKDALVDQLRDLQSSLAPMADVPPANRHWSSSESREECRQQIDESARLQTAILEIDARCEQAMMLRRDELFDSLRHTTSAIGASRAYASAARPANSSSGRGGSFDLTSG